MLNMSIIISFDAFFAVVAFCVRNLIAAKYTFFFVVVVVLFFQELLRFLGHTPIIRFPSLPTPQENLIFQALEKIFFSPFTNV